MLNLTDKRPKPYVWVTWITGLLAGTDRCQWRAWVKAQYKLPKKEEKQEDKTQLQKWMADHTAMTEARVERLRADGHLVRVEEENSFKLDGKNAVLSGTPDIVALTGPSEALIIDEKSGKEKDQYVWQVILYMFAMSLTHLKGRTIRGEVEYKNKTVPVRADQLSLANIDRIKKVMQVMGGETPPPTAPSASECRYCDVIACPDRYSAGEVSVEGF